MRIIMAGQSEEVVRLTARGNVSSAAAVSLFFLGILSLYLYI